MDARPKKESSLVSTASRGRALEHEVRELFRQDGWSAPLVSGSKCGLRWKSFVSPVVVLR